MSSVFLRLCMSVSTCSFSTISIYLCRVFGQRDPSGFIPSPLERYRQILLPTLRLLQVILTSTTTHHQQGAAQVQFLLMHSCAYGPHWLVCNCFVCVCVCVSRCSTGWLCTRTPFSQSCIVRMWAWGRYRSCLCSRASSVKLPSQVLNTSKKCITNVNAHIRTMWNNPMCSWLRGPGFWARGQQCSHAGVPGTHWQIPGTDLKSPWLTPVLQFLW